MAEVVTGLLYLVGLLFVGSTLAGVIFDRTEPGRKRDASIGLELGLLASAAIFAAVSLPGGSVIDLRMPFLILAGLFGGPIGALCALPIPVAIRIAAGGTWMVGVASIVVGVLLGLGVRTIRASLGRPLNRTAVLWVAGISPLVLLTTLFIPMPTSALLSTVIVPLAVFNVVGTVCLGLAVISERIRSETSRAVAVRDKLERHARLVPAEVFRSQLLHHWKLHEFFNTPHAYMLVSIDNAGALQRTMGPKRFAKLRADVAKILSGLVRDGDVATARDFDRFSVLLPQSNVDVARAVAGRVQDRVASSVAGALGTVTVSIGLADATEGFCAGDVEAIAEGALFQANARKSSNAIGPAYSETLAADNAPLAADHRVPSGESPDDPGTPAFVADPLR